MYMCVCSTSPRDPQTEGNPWGGTGAAYIQLRYKTFDQRKKGSRVYTSQPIEQLSTHFTT